MIIIGMVCLQMFTAQNILNTFDETKKRTLYAAEGMTEAFRGYVESETAANLKADGDSWNSTDGFLYMNVSAAPGGKWSPFTMGTNYDTYMYPDIKASAYIEEITSFAGEDNGTQIHSGLRPVAVNNHPQSVYYKIVGIASATVNLQLIVSTVTYYFYTVRAGDGVGVPYSHVKHFRSWRKS